MNELAARVLRGDILKTLYYQDALRAESSVGSLLLWSALREAGHHEDGAPWAARHWKPSWTIWPRGVFW